MRYRNLAKSTQRIYASAVRALADHLTTKAPADVTRPDIESFVTARLAQVKPATVSADFRALQQFFKWTLLEDEMLFMSLLHLSGTGERGVLTGT